MELGAQEARRQRLADTRAKVGYLPGGTALNNWLFLAIWLPISQGGLIRQYEAHLLTHRVLHTTRFS